MIHIQPPTGPQGLWAIVWRPPSRHPFDPYFAPIDPPFKVLAVYDDLGTLLEAWPIHEHRYCDCGGTLDAIDPEGVLLSSMEFTLHQ